MQTSCVEVFALAPFIACETLLMTWIPGRYPSPMQAEVLISWVFSFAQQNAQTCFANADLLSKISCNYISVSHFKFACPTKAMLLKVLLFSSTLFFSLEPWWCLFYSLNLKTFLVNLLAYFQGFLSSYTHLWRKELIFLAKQIFFCFYLNSCTINISAWRIFAFASMLLM